MKNPHSHLIHTFKLFFKGKYLKLTILQSLDNQNFQIFPTFVLFPPDNAYDTYIEIDNDFQLKINFNNALVAKAHIWFDTGDILWFLYSLISCSLKELSYYLSLKCILPETLLLSLVIMRHYKSKLVANERRWWLCLIRFLKLSHAFWISNGIVYSQYASKFVFFPRDGLRHNL